MTFTLPSLPRACRWINQPVDWRVSPEQSLTITAGACMDWFIDPAGADAKNNAPVADRSSLRLPLFAGRGLLASRPALQFGASG